MRPSTFLCIACLLAPLAACGIKGPLYLPAPAAADAKAPADLSKPSQDNPK